MVVRPQWMQVVGERGRVKDWSTPPPTGLLRGYSSVGLVVTGDGDAALAAARFTPPADLGPGQNQQTIGRQGAGDRWLVDAGGEAVAAVELARDVTVVVLKHSRE